MFKRLKLWWILREIRRLEKMEAEQKASLIHLQTKLLPSYRKARNLLTY